MEAQRDGHDTSRRSPKLMLQTHVPGHYINRWRRWDPQGSPQGTVLVYNGTKGHAMYS